MRSNADEGSSGPLRSGGASARPVNVLREVFGYAEFRGPQQEIIEHLMGGDDALVIMPTGMGKSLCYQIPALLFPRATDVGMTGDEDCEPGTTGPSLTLVLSPLIALMKDQVDALVRRGVSATYINSSLGRKARESRYQAVSEGEYRLLYVTPERFRKQEFLGAMRRRTVRLLAVDEAHCISEWGHDFRPDYTRLAAIRAELDHPVTLALTATATPDVQADILRQLGLDAGAVRLFHEGIDRPNLRLSVETTWDDDSKMAAIRQVLQSDALAAGSGIVYFTLIKTLDIFSRRLLREGITHVCYHGDLARDERRKIQNEFMEGRCPLVLATNAFGMGIDKDDIRFVIHAELPGSMEAYYQEIGRAGRDGLPSQCTLLYEQSDLATQMQFLEWRNPDADFYENVYRMLIDRAEEVRAFGMEWLSQQVQERGKHDHRLDTVLAMFDRHGVVRGRDEPDCWDVIGDLPEILRDNARLRDKRLHNHKKLHALVEFVNEPGDRKAFIHRYFGLP